MSDQLLALPEAIRASALSYIRTAYRTNSQTFNDSRDRLLTEGELSRSVFGGHRVGWICVEVV